MKTILEAVSKEWPVSVLDIKKHYSLNEKHDYIENLLQSAYEYIELETQLSLRKKTWRMVHNNYYFVLQFGPVIEIFSIKDETGKEIKPLAVRRLQDNMHFQFSEKISRVEIRYQTGYSKNDLPECLKLRVLDKFWELYSENTSQNYNFYEAEVANANYYVKY